MYEAHSTFQKVHYMHGEYHITLALQSPYK